MRFRPRAHPYAALAEADHHADTSSGSHAGGGGSELSRLLLLGGAGGGRMLPHCPPGGEDTEADTARENNEETDERSEEDQEGRDDDGDNNNALPDQKRKDHPFLLRSDPFRLLPPSHPCSGQSHSHPNNSNAASEAERSARLEQLLVATGRYLRWPLAPFHEAKEWDVLREELAVTFGSDQEVENIMEGENITEEGESDGNIVAGGEGDNTIAVGGSDDNIAGVGCARARRRRGGGGSLSTILLGRSHSNITDGNGDDDDEQSTTWDDGLYPDIVPGTDFAHTMGCLLRQGACDDGAGGLGGGGGGGGGGGDGVTCMVIEEPSRLIRRDPDLPHRTSMPSVGTTGMGGGAGSASDAAVSAASPRLLSVLPSIQRLAASGGWGPPSPPASTSDNTGDNNDGEDMEMGGSGGAASPTSIWEYDGSSSASTTSAAAKALRPPFRLAPPVIVTEADRLEEYDADLCRNSGGGGGGSKEKEEEEAAPPACFSEEWVRKRKRKWKMQRAIRESITVVNEQRLLPLRAAGLAPTPLSSPSRLDDRMRIDADLPTKDCPPTGHLQAQANAARLDRDIIEHLRENFAPSSFLESQVNARYKGEIEQDKEQDPREALLNMLSSSGDKDAISIARPPCTLIAKLGSQGDEEAPASPTVADIPSDDFAHLPSLIRKDPPLPGTEDREQPPKIRLPSAMSTIKSMLPTSSALPSMKSSRNHDADTMNEAPPRSLNDVVSTAGMVERRSVGQIMLSSRSHDHGGMMIPQQPFAPRNGVTPTEVASGAMEAQNAETEKVDADLAASVRSFLSQTRETERFVAGSALARKANGYECRSWFVDEDNPLPDYGENRAADPQDVQHTFQDRAWRRNREEQAREMVMTGAKMKRERGCCTYRGFLTNIVVNPRYFAARYLAMLQYNHPLKANTSGDTDEVDLDLSAANVPSFLVPPSTSPMVSADAPCTAGEAALRIFHRSLARTNMENLLERQETGKILPEPQTMLLRNRRHPNMAKSDRRTKKLSSLGLAGSSNRRTRTFINARKRPADDSSRSSISFHDVFVVKQRKGLGFLTSDADEGSTISAQPPSVLCTLGSIESLGKESVGIRGELCHLQNKAAEIAREEEAYWREMSVVGGPQRIDTGSRLAFSPKSRGAADRDANPRGGSGGDNTAEEGKKANVLKSSTNIPDHHQQQGAASLGSEDDTNMKTAAEAKAERRERKKRKKERRREKKARKRERKERKRREKENGPPEVGPLAGRPIALTAAVEVVAPAYLSSSSKTVRSAPSEQTPPPNASSSTLTSASHHSKGGSAAAAAARNVGYTPNAPPASTTPMGMGPNAIAAGNLGFTPKALSASRLPCPPSNRAASAAGGASVDRAEHRYGPNDGSANSNAPFTAPLDKAISHYNGQALAVTSQPITKADEDQTIRALVSEAFFECFGEVVADLSTGQYARAFFEGPEKGIASMELAGEGWGNVHTIGGGSRKRKRLPTEQIRSILLYDSVLIDGQQVDIELPGKAAVVALRLSSWSSSMSAQGEPPKEAKNFVRRLVNVAALGRYKVIHVLLCADVDVSSSLLNGIGIFQNAMSLESVKTIVHHVTNKTIAPAIANLMLSAYDRCGREIDADTAWIEDVSSTKEPLLERVRLLLSLCSSMTAMRAFELARLPRPLAHIMLDIVGDHEQGGQSSFQMGRMMTASLNGGG